MATTLIIFEKTNYLEITLIFTLPILGTQPPYVEYNYTIIIVF